MSTYQISKSALLSLKAEVLKKKNEINKVKLVNKTIIENKVRKGKLEFKNKGVEERQKNDLTDEEQDLLKKSRSILEQKAKLYDKLSKGVKNEELSKRLLVKFNDKVGYKPDDDESDKYPESEEEPINDEEYNAENSDEEWVEYTDCLGRTRTCLKKDLKFIKEKDENLRTSVNKDENRKDKKENKKQEVEKEEEVIIIEEREMLSSDMRREMQRQQWEKEEEELRNKSSVHYQDVLFSEARSHGVAYYSFSKDDEERRKQQESLNNLRKETEEQQKVAIAMRNKRKRILAVRVLAAKNRQRARMGLPPLTEDDEEKAPDEEEVKEDTPIETPLSEEEIKQQKKLEEKRKKHIRPWDIGKDGINITKKHYEHSQEEWVELQRQKRDEDFAPPRSYNSSVKSYDIDDSEEPGKGSLYFSTTIKHKNQKKDTFKKRTYEKPNVSESTYVPINNECSSEEEEIGPRSRDEDEEEIRPTSRAEIPPPPTYDYYGPSTSKRRKADNVINMEESIMEGLKYFREKVEQK